MGRVFWTDIGSGNTKREVRPKVVVFRKITVGPQSTFVLDYLSKGRRRIN